MAGKRTRKAAAEETMVDVTAIGVPHPKSSMEESADALAGVEGALTGTKRKAQAAPVAAVGGSPPKKKSARAAATRPRSNSIERLVDVAGALLQDDIAPPGLDVPNPMAQVVAVEPIVPPAVAIAAAAAAAAPTGYRKAAPKAATRQPATKQPVVKLAAASATAPTAPAPSNMPPLNMPLDGSLASKKAQITYNPDIAMTKEQLTSWRREMRRVRNRESAAASRRKVRDRIEELEDELAVWKKRYCEVVSRLDQAQKQPPGGDSGRKSG